MEKAFSKVCADMEAQLKACDGEGDHVHILVEYPPTLSVSVLVNSLKGVSSRLLRRDHAELKDHSALWSPSYFAASCGGAPLDLVKQYIDGQRSPS